MDNLKEKIELIEKLNTDDSRFIVNVYESYKNHKVELENKLHSTSIVLKDKFYKSAPNIIDLDQIWCKPFFYTKMRIHLNGILQKLSRANISEMSKNPSKFCKSVIFHNISKKFEKPKDKIDIVDFIKILSKRYSASFNDNFTFIAKKIDEETIFKEEQLIKAIEIINLDTLKAKYDKIYDEVYSYLKNDFVANNYCDFHNNKCIAQRHFTLYPLNRKNGCCFTRIRTCPHLQKGGSCNVDCMACRLFSCPFLSKRGITYYASEFVLLKAFLTKEQRKHFVFDFYKSKDYVLKRII